MATNPNAGVQRWPTPTGDAQDPANRLIGNKLQDLNDAISELKRQLTAVEDRITAAEGRISALGG